MAIRYGQIIVTNAAYRKRFLSIVLAWDLTLIAVFWGAAVGAHCSPYFCDLALANPRYTL